MRRGEWASATPIHGLKLHRSHTVEQIARLFDIHKNTVRAWVKQGLQPIDGRRPALFHGPVLVAFLQRRRESAKQPCPPGHIYCLPCRAPKAPAGNMAEFVPVTDTTGNLRGICPDCDRLIHRRVNQVKIKAIQGNLEITFADAPRRISPTSGRAYYSQANIRQLWGPSIAKELVKEPAPEAFKKKVLEVFTPRLTHELERMIKSIDARAHMAPGQLSASESTA
jgi:hypothetical protein